MKDNIRLEDGKLVLFLFSSLLFIYSYFLSLFSLFGFIAICVVATTRQNCTCDMLTSAKLSTSYLVVGITRELNKKPLLYCYPIYISYKWSMLQQCVYLMSTP